jgi:predicted dehydrogenase
MAETLGIAIFGTGFASRVHLETVRRLGRIHVRGIASSDPERARDFGAEFGVKTVVADYRKLLEDREVNAVDICSSNALHYQMAKDAIEAGKHVICEKPLATSVDDARKLVTLAAKTQLRNCTCYNLRYYPLVQQMRRMREEGELGDILAVQGTYSQDWLLRDTDWNWRIDTKDNGPSRAMADIGSHWCDMAEHVTGLRMTALCADLQTFHKTRKRPLARFETFGGKVARPQDYTQVPIDSEDFGAVLFRMGERTRGAFTVSQVSAGRKNRLSLEVYGTKQSVAWDGERPNELWIGMRDEPNRMIIRDPSLLSPGARDYADLPGGHAEGYADTFKQLFRLFYRSVEDSGAGVDYPAFTDGLRQMELIEAALTSNREHAWVKV